MLARNGDTFTFEDALQITGLSRASLKKLLYRLERGGWIERVQKGKYMIIPLGSGKGRFTLHEFVIGSLLADPYCISYWSALHFHGMTEQLPGTVYVQTTQKKKDQQPTVFGVDYQIVRVMTEKMFGIRKVRIEETSVNITDKEKTVADCLDKPQYCGGVVEVAKALRYTDLDLGTLCTYAQSIGNTGVVRRLGYLSDLLGIELDLPRPDTRNYLYLDPTMPRQGLPNAKWRLIINLDEKTLGVLE
jgi:predicted transcriptional regulator of viral defense system